MKWNMYKTAIVAITTMVVGTISIADVSGQLLRWRRNRCCCPTYTQVDPCCGTAHAGGYRNGGMAYAQPAYGSGYTVTHNAGGCGPGMAAPATVYRSTGPVYAPTVTPNQAWTSEPRPSNGQTENGRDRQDPPTPKDLNETREEFTPPFNPDQRNDAEPVPDKSGG